LTHLPWTGDR